MEGMKLKTWVLGEKIGSGACSDVFSVKSVSSLESDANCKFVIKVSPLPQIPAAKLKNKKRKKTLTERNADALYAEHLLYKNHLRDQPGIPYVPTGAYGEDKGFRFLVIERLGRTLETVLQEQGPVSSVTAARLGQEILETLQQMHVKNILYVDVKPENFMLDTDEENKVYCVDFGISDRYITAAGKHKDLREGAVVGTPTFLSVNCHNGATSSRRDDVESLLYVLIYLMRGDLPWQQASSDAEGAKIKEATLVDHLCASMPREWGIMLKRIRDCGFEDRPDYDFFAQQFLKLGGKKGLMTPYEWGSHKTNKAAAKAVAVTSESSSHKGTEGIDKDRKISQHVAVKVRKNEASGKKRSTPRSKKAPIKKAAFKIRKTSKINHEADELEEKVADVGKIQPQDREVYKAIAGHAAATAALKRYNLRSK